jgi:hypothetical protein
MRHSKFVAIREDKPAAEVEAEARLPPRISCADEPCKPNLAKLAGGHNLPRPFPLGSS